MNRLYGVIFMACTIPVLLVSNPTPRLMICVDSKAEFTAQKLSERINATYVDVDQRNPYKALLPICLEHSVVCISFDDPTPLIKRIRRLAHRCGYRYLNFTAESLDEAVAKTTIEQKIIPKYSSEIYHMKLEDSQRLYNLLEKIDRVFSQSEITYWGGRGTLLGAVRHQGIMPWEDYHTLHIIDTDEVKMQALAEAFDNEGLILHYNKERDFYKIFDKNGDIIPNPANPDEILPFRYPVADLFVMSLECRHEVEDIYVHRSWFHFFHWGTETFSYEQIHGIHRVPFGPLNIPIPSSSELTLNQIYGMPQAPELWKKYALEPFWDHRIESDHLWQGNSLVLIDDYSPAPW